MSFSWLTLFIIWLQLVTSQQDDCDCVPFYLCYNGTISTSGEGIIDIRTNDCKDYLEVCCKLENVTTFEPLVEVPKGCGYRNPNGVGYRITGDENNESQFGEFPWMVAIFRRQQGETKHLYRCGGSLIHPKVVLTAAHCVNNPDDTFKIRAGEWDSQTRNEMFKHQDREVSSTVIHPRFNKPNLRNDIGLLFLKEAVALANHINIACLPSQGLVASGGGCFVTGWGTKSFESKTQYQVILKKTELSVMNRESCQEAYRTTRLGEYFNLNRSFMCAGGEEGEDACTGDGGGPLVCPIGGQPTRFQQVGIVSWGIGCGTKGIPGVYVDVAYFRNWIDNELRKKNLVDTNYEA